ncbi:MAG TPA: prepilin-type N-terminal cleavage/methylation domain-containing protein [Vicinamibacterales bacterium]|jgi:prepilin-type N-terminal cleavage/methylation domain-containing protein
MLLKDRRTLRDDAGFTLLEIMVVVALMGVLAAMAIMVSPSFTQTARADSGIAQVLDAIRSAREVAISQRRNVQLRFIGNNAIQTVRVEIGANGQVTGTTVLRTVELENRMRFDLDADVPDDTPDGFGRTGAISFGASPTRMFTSEGTFVNATGDVLNGTAFMLIPNQENSARAITIMGATALIRAYRWNGREWVE